MRTSSNRRRSGTGGDNFPEAYIIELPKTIRLHRDGPCVHGHVPTEHNLIRPAKTKMESSSVALVGRLALATTHPSPWCFSAQMR